MNDTGLPYDYEEDSRTTDSAGSSGVDMPRTQLSRSDFTVIKAKIVDFGTSANLWRNGSPHMQREMGTLNWMPPEVMALKKSDAEVHYGTAIDIYTVGLVIYEMLSGLKPFHDCQKLQIALKGERPCAAAHCPHCLCTPSHLSTWRLPHTQLTAAGGGSTARSGHGPAPVTARLGMPAAAGVDHTLLPARGPLTAAIYRRAAVADAAHRLVRLQTAVRGAALPLRRRARAAATGRQRWRQVPASRRLHRGCLPQSKVRPTFAHAAGAAPHQLVVC
jgi:hypothetical protein